MINFSKTHILIILLVSAAIFTACTNKKNMAKLDYIEDIHGSFIVEEDDIGPPPIHIESRFVNFEDWLTFIITNEKPSKAIETYNIDVFERQDTYTLCLTGVNKYDISSTHHQIKIEYNSNEKFFQLPTGDIEGLKRDQVFENLTSRLNEFMITDKFQRSFFTKAKSINTSWKGEIWLRK